jgi:hypothetical protein
MRQAADAAPANAGTALDSKQECQQQLSSMDEQCMLLYAPAADHAVSFATAWRHNTHEVLQEAGS